jgi:acyl-CoA reductase-like NAD-dependent aldehyde dehydrogenase
MDWCLANQQLIVKWSTEETGKTVTEASLGEVLTTCEKIRWLIAHGNTVVRLLQHPCAIRVTRS